MPTDAEPEIEALDILTIAQHEQLGRPMPQDEERHTQTSGDGSA